MHAEFHETIDKTTPFIRSLEPSSVTNASGKKGEKEGGPP